MLRLVHDFEDNQLDFADWLWFCDETNDECMKHFISKHKQLLNIWLTRRSVKFLNLLDLGDVSSWSSKVEALLMTTHKFAQNIRMYSGTNVNILVPFSEFSYSLQEAQTIQNRDSDLAGRLMNTVEFGHHLLAHKNVHFRIHFNEDGIGLMRQLRSQDESLDGWFYENGVVSLLPLIQGKSLIFCAQPGEYLIDRRHPVLRIHVSKWFEKYF